MVMKRYEEYISAEVDTYMDDCVSIGSDEEYCATVKDIAHELVEDDALSVAIEKLVRERVRRELDKRGVKYE